MGGVPESNVNIFGGKGNWWQNFQQLKTCLVRTFVILQIYHVPTRFFIIIEKYMVLGISFQSHI